MAFYKFNRDLPMGQDLRSSLDHLRAGMAGLNRHNAAMTQMSNAQITDVYGVSPTTVSGSDADSQSAALKAELASDVGQLNSVAAALNQLLAQTG